MLYISYSSKKERNNSRHDDVQLDIFEDLDPATAVVCFLFQETGWLAFVACLKMTEGQNP